MKGLELARAFYAEYGEPMLKAQFGDILGFLAVGLVGSGSECFGYDDIYSQDHDFEPGFCIFLPDEDIVDRKTAFALERAYSKLPQEFMGYKRSLLSPVGGNRHGVIRINEFLESRTGSYNANLSNEQFFAIPEQALAELMGGELFFDNYGLFSEIRSKLSYFPEDVRLKKLAGNLLLMGQAGQYNYPRCVSRGESAAAQLAAHEFVRATLAVIFLLNKRYMPYYKWSFRALSELAGFSELYGELEYLISSRSDSDEAQRKIDTIAYICRTVASALEEQALSDSSDESMERHAYEVNRRISEPNLRNSHILYAI